MRTFVPALLLLFTMTARAADPPYSVDKIPAPLLKNTNAVKRMEALHFEIVSNTSTRLKHKYAFTIFNEEGDKFSAFSKYYDKLRVIDFIEGSLYDAQGKLVKRLKSKDIRDVSGTSDISLMEDNRVKTHDFHYRNYPYTVEYEVGIHFNHSFYFPYWVVQEDQHLSVEKSSFTVSFPSDYQLRYKAINYPGEPVVSETRGTKTLTWQVSGLPALLKEPYAPRWQELTASVSIAPSDFQVGAYKGNMNSWENFGKFMSHLKQDRDILPESIKQKVKDLTAGLSSDSLKVVTLYRFLQQNTRYISIQLGIGGWQPFEASYVAEKGYGDCKALSNYMYSLLKEAGIRSHYALIRAGNGDHFMLEDFPSVQFNHAILSVPLERDTIWLECTDQTKAPGYMGDFTGNRKALLITENGGKLVSTPAYGSTDNLQLRTIHGSIDANGNLAARVRTQYHAMEQDELHYLLNHFSKEKVKEVLQSSLDLPSYEINDFKYQQKTESSPVIDEDLDISVPAFATVTGKRVFIEPNPINRSHRRLSADANRKHEVVLSRAFTQIDSVRIEIPEGYEIESLPPPVRISNAFGTYSSAVTLTGNQLNYVRTQVQFTCRRPAAEYERLVWYFDEIYKADRGKVVLVRKR